MKLIVEQVDAQFIEEEVAGGTGKKLFIEGVFLMGDIKNRNGRLYPMAVLDKEVSRYNEQYVKQNGAYGELGHPQGPTINPDRISHIIKSLTKEGTNYIGKAEVITENAMGSIVQNILRHGGRLGVSSRGMGSLVEKDGINEVQGDFYLATAADIVTDPSAPSAFVNGIYESLEWVFDERLGWRAIETAERIRESFIKEKPAAISEERKLRAFEAWLNQISR